MGQGPTKRMVRGRGRRKAGVGFGGTRRRSGGERSRIGFAGPGAWGTVPRSTEVPLPGAGSLEEHPMSHNNRRIRKANHGKRPCCGKQTRAKKRIHTPR
jgi:hypothetical protein